ncbi:MAG: TATA-box-binding protein, partial [Candidatus Jordarchaeales archaeon]
ITPHKKRRGGMPKAKSIHIENVVASVILNQRLDLNLIAERLPNTEFDPDQFPGLVLRLEQPKTATLIFNSGKMVCTGSKSEKDAVKAVKKIVESLREVGIDIKNEPIIQVQNIVASANLGVELNLEEAAFLLENTLYEPEQFPGLIYRMHNPKVVILLFGSGKAVITGAKREEDIFVAVDRVMEVLTEKGIIRE